MNNFDVNLIDLFKLKLKSSINCDTNEKSFENSIKIYINKPQVVNKWTAGSILIDDSDINYDSIINDNDRLSIQKCLNNPKYEIENREFLSKNKKHFKNIKYFIVNDSIMNLFLFKPYFTNNDVDSLKYCSCWFTFAFQYISDEKSINLYVADLDNVKDSNGDHVTWLNTVLLKKISNWCLNIAKNSVCDDDYLNESIKLSTLTLYKNMLIDYYKLYQELKERYSALFNNKNINWNELTNTNAEKFIHEDISIATYLILTWRYFNYTRENVKFVDLGCGNGLLVYILAEEGYNGYGIDLRKRRIWDIYLNNSSKNKNFNLIETAIDARTAIYNDCNWLIGNHSDELSPWLPLIANRNLKNNTNLFLIPCCFFDFNEKYCFLNIKQNETRYDNYINYLINVFELNAFNVYKDKLRIPSTKNICLIGIRDPEKEINFEKLNVLLNRNKDSFKIRDIEKEKLKTQRNCTRNVDQDLKESIVKTILNDLLNIEEIVNKSSENENKSFYLKKYDNTDWNAGRARYLSELISLFDKNTLAKLKQECGGIKTLIKNYHQLFEIVNKDQVKLRTRFNDDTKNDDLKKFHKTRPCLFDLYHPDGCLLDANKCNFIHKTSN